MCVETNQVAAFTRGRKRQYFKRLRCWITPMWVGVNTSFTQSTWCSEKVAKHLKEEERGKREKIYCTSVALMLMNTVTVYSSDSLAYCTCCCRCCCLIDYACKRDALTSTTLIEWVELFIGFLFNPMQVKWKYSVAKVQRSLKMQCLSLIHY